MRKSWPIGVLAASFALFVGIATIAKQNGWDEYLLLIRQGSKTEATVIEAGPELRYTFKVAGASYLGSAENFSASVGQTVPVTYLPAAPSNSCLSSPAARLADEIASFLAGGLYFPDQQ